MRRRRSLGPHYRRASAERLHPGRARDPQAVRRARAVQAHRGGHDHAAHPNAEIERNRDLINKGHLHTYIHNSMLSVLLFGHQSIRYLCATIAIEAAEAPPSLSRRFGGRSPVGHRQRFSVGRANARKNAFKLREILLCSNSDDVFI